jgi:hypothetical protein
MEKYYKQLRKHYEVFDDVFAARSEEFHRELKRLLKEEFQ